MKDPKTKRLYVSQLYGSSVANRTDQVTTSSRRSQVSPILLLQTTGTLTLSLNWTTQCRECQITGGLNRTAQCRESGITERRVRSMWRHRKELQEGIVRKDHIPCESTRKLRVHQKLRRRTCAIPEMAMLQGPGRGAGTQFKCVQRLKQLADVHMETRACTGMGLGPPRQWQDQLHQGTWPREENLEEEF